MLVIQYSMYDTFFVAINIHLFFCFIYLNCKKTKKHEGFFQNIPMAVWTTCRQHWGAALAPQICVLFCEYLFDGLECVGHSFFPLWADMTIYNNPVIRKFREKSFATKTIDRFQQYFTRHCACKCLRNVIAGKTVIGKVIQKGNRMPLCTQKFKKKLSIGIVLR
jgi:hypothetical protein